MMLDALVPSFLLALAGAASAETTRQDYTTELTPLAQMASDGKFREAIGGYRKLQERTGTSTWLRAAAEFEIADLYAALHESDSAIDALGKSVQMGYDDCLSPLASDHLASVLKTPKAAQALAAMRISEADFRELAWLKREVDNAGHDARLMIADNVERVDQQDTEVPQVQVPTRQTTSAGVLYWRQQLLLMQRAQREFVASSDQERMVHAATLAIANGSSSSAVLESARAAHASAEGRRADVLKRAFAPVPASDQLRTCSQLASRPR